MSSGSPLSAQASFLRRTSRVLASAGRLLQVRLELRARGDTLASTHRTPRVCRECREGNPETERACRRQRAALAAGVSLRRRDLSWNCPRGVAILAWPLAGPLAADTSLLCLDPGGREPTRGPVAGSISQSGRPRAARDPATTRRDRFLRDLAQMLSEESYLVGEVTLLGTELALKHDELRMFYSVAGRFSGGTELGATLREVAERARSTQHADAAFVSLPSRRVREVVARPGLDGLDPTRRRLWNEIETTVQRRLEEQGPGAYLGSPWSVGGPSSPAGRPLQVLAVPLATEGRPGIFCLIHLDPEKSFRASDVKLMESLAEQVRLASTNAVLFEDLQLFLMATVKSLVGAIEEKDPYTSGHSERVNLVSMLIGRAMNLRPEQMETLRWASILHDVGKIGMPESILRKPGRLSGSEFTIIREHPDRGYRLLRPIRQLEDAARCVRAHHERVDGTGYPEGLRGAEIPLLSRIISVADTFDALTSNRSYRTARAFDEALAEIRRVQGSQLDTEIVERFFELVPFLREHQVMIEATLATERPRAA